MPNRLASESSPYLRQHADNPVDWYPWGDEAFSLARASDRPVLLSVGYSACHWCHVMAHESFEDPATATVMNRLFVSIKVDREERPDVDDIYMQAVMAMSGSGGWPMTVFLAPDGRPFFGGTYFPKAPGHGRPGFVQLLEAIDEAWRQRRDELLTQADQLVETIRERTAVIAPPDDVGISADTLDGGYQALAVAFDPVWGGFGRAPKFPTTSNLDLLLRAYAHNGAPGTLAMVTTSLDAMASGGIYDHLGGGFARYSTDREWLVPHFEKMLYDNALILRPFLAAWQLTGRLEHRQVIEETVAYVHRDLTGPEGGVYSAEDADSEGVEGKFYVWTPGEIAAVVGSSRDDASEEEAAAAAEVCTWYGVTEAGNFEGANILHRPVRGELRRPPAVESARTALMQARMTRVRPGLDDKVITEWNAMWIATLAPCAAALGRADWLESATRTADFLCAMLRRPDGRWLRCWQRDGGARHLAYAVDYAHLVDAFTRLAEATGRRRWVSEATAAADGLLGLFWDDTDGGLFTTGADAEHLLVRGKDVYDGATPSANSVAAVALLRLGAVTGSARYTDAAQTILRLLHAYLTQAPMSVTVALAAADLVVSGITEIVVAGDRTDLVAQVVSRYLPNAVLAWGEPFDSPLWEGRAEPAAYVCRDYTCGLPARTATDLAAQLGAP
jgi:uncharacterized protein